MKCTNCHEDSNKTGENFYCEECVDRWLKSDKQARKEATIEALRTCKEIAVSDYKEQIKASENTSEAIQHRSAHAYAAQKLEEVIVKIQCEIQAEEGGGQ